MAYNGESVCCQRCLNFQIVSVAHCSWLVNIVISSNEVLFTPNFFKENWSFLLFSVAFVRTNFFFLWAVPSPPMHSHACNLASFPWFMIASFILLEQKWGRMGTRIGTQMVSGRPAEMRHTHVGTQNLKVFLTQFFSFSVPIPWRLGES